MFPFFKQWTVFPPWKNSELSKLLPTLDSALELQGEVISLSKQSKIFSLTLADRTYFIKQYFTTPGINSWLGLSRLRIETRNQQLFQRLAIPSAAVVAYGEKSLLGVKTLKGVLVTEGLDSVSDLRKTFNSKPEKFRNKHWRNAITKQLAEITAKLHQDNFCHNDLHFRNILVQEISTAQDPKIFLIDCPSGKHFSWPILSYRIKKDLAGLDKLAPKVLSKTQRLRFFLAYRKITRLRLKDKKFLLSVLAHKEHRTKRKSIETNHL